MTRSPHREPDRRPPAPSAGGAIEPTTARELAFACLQAFDDSGFYLSDSLDRLQGRPLSTADRALAMELSYTVLRRRATLDAVLRQLVSRDPASVERDLWTVLQLGVVQLLLIPGLPPHAAVHETVELAKRINGRWGGMVNGVLRSLQRLVTGNVADAPSASGVPIVAADPAREGEGAACLEIVYRQLGANVFPDFARDPVGYVATAFSMPRELMARWSNGWDPAAALRQAAWFTTPGVLSLRINPLRTDRVRLIESLRSIGAECWPGDLPESIRLAESTRIARLPGFEDGHFSVQDESAMRIVDLLDPRPGERVLDLCSAPGGKSTHAAERMLDQGTVVACDLSERRLRLVEQSAARLGLNAISTQLVADDPASIPDGPFDAAMVDAPCSNMGVLGKRPEARWRLTEEDFQELPALQLRLLEAAAERVKRDGRLVYSTCSIDALENEGVIRQFLARQPVWSATTQLQSVPSEPGDGGFVAVLRRN
ncbi:Ribosomal RNA small subunit methyltransferase B [Caulifigura coniformis]|uniref:Ribosomal RNA small subunit methyltransferase B n=1 Tax=Caulifigura coniformis TaxID=2527983 RepID=A0A517SG54_9PLAN|nr:transcription antitermination factor NusB [Caulifigura coniformis]QDT55116.1 Ribosomal RNA small subunit methyltransferase B [Caulifigura coniformis]